MPEVVSKSLLKNCSLWIGVMLFHREQCLQSERGCWEESSDAICVWFLEGFWKAFSEVGLDLIRSDYSKAWGEYDPHPLGMILNSLWIRKSVLRMQIENKHLFFLEIVFNTFRTCSKDVDPYGCYQWFALDHMDSNNFCIMHKLLILMIKLLSGYLCNYSSWWRPVALTYALWET
jgi:hypothetical protein